LVIELQSDDSTIQTIAAWTTNNPPNPIAHNFAFTFLACCWSDGWLRLNL